MAPKITTMQHDAWSNLPRNVESCKNKDFWYRAKQVDVVGSVEDGRISSVGDDTSVGAVAPAKAEAATAGPMPGGRSDGDVAFDKSSQGVVAAAGVGSLDRAKGIRGELLREGFDGDCDGNGWACGVWRSSVPAGVQTPPLEGVVHGDSHGWLWSFASGPDDPVAGTVTGTVGAAETVGSEGLTKCVSGSNCASSTCAQNNFILRPWCRRKSLRKSRVTWTK